MLPCCLCQEKCSTYKKALCDSCALSFKQEKARSVLGALTLHPYDEKMRDLILKVKIERNYRSLFF